jgi:hypothetical protein
MKTIRPLLWGISFLLAGASLAVAQDATTPTVPRILTIQREWIKPGKSGQLHDRTEAAYVSAFAKAKFSAHYVALNSLSGKSRALYITTYSSLAELEKANKTAEASPTLSADLEHAGLTDGDLLEGTDTAVLTSEEEMSFHPRGNLAKARFLEISSYHVKPGHTAEWHELVKLVQDTYAKTDTKFHWAMFSLIYGGEGDTYIVLSSKESMAELDAGLNDKSFDQALGEDGMKKLEGLVRECIASSSHELFSVNPKQSYVDEAWIKADPDFWKPKKAAPETAAAKPAAKAPAAAKPSTR